MQFFLNSNFPFDHNPDMTFLYHSGSTSMNKGKGVVNLQRKDTKIENLNNQWLY